MGDMIQFDGGEAEPAQQKELTPEELHALQIETLGAIAEYLERLIPAMITVSGEMLGNMQEDTEDVLMQVVEGMNWVIQAFNGTMGVFNEKTVKLNPKELDNHIVKLSDALIAKDNETAAHFIADEIVPYFQRFSIVAKEYGKSDK